MFCDVQKYSKFCEVKNLLSHRRCKIDIIYPAMSKNILCPGDSENNLSFGSAKSENILALTVKKTEQKSMWKGWGLRGTTLAQNREEI